MKFLNNKGFTLVELLVVMVILGIITAFSIPMIRNIQQKNNISKFKVFEDSLINGAKLYIDSYGEDEFSETTVCRDISFNEMKDKMLVKDFTIEGVNCNTEDTFVRVTKDSKKNYRYSVQISCVSGNNEVYKSGELKEDIRCK